MYFYNINMLTVYLDLNIHFASKIMTSDIMFFLGNL